MIGSQRGLTVPTHVHDCPFCAIVENQDPTVREVYRDEHVVAFFPREPATLGHTLVIPRTHIATIWNLSEPAAGKLASEVVRLSAAIGRALRPEGLNVIQSNGVAASQTILHLHVHLVPRWEDDAMGQIWPHDVDFADHQIDEAWNRLRHACRQSEADD